jgi:hypothetical protein
MGPNRGVINAGDVMIAGADDTLDASNRGRCQRSVGSSVGGQRFSVWLEPLWSFLSCVELSHRLEVC